MSYEDPPTSETDQEFIQQAEQILVEHGEEYFHEQFGLGREELQQTVTFGGHQGSVAAMLTDEKCPVGGKLAEAYREGGLEAVQTKANQLSEFAPEFSLPIVASSWQREAQKKEPQRSDFLDQPQVGEAQILVKALGKVQTDLAEPHIRAMLETASVPNSETLKDKVDTSALAATAEAKAQSRPAPLVPVKTRSAKTMPASEFSRTSKIAKKSAPTRPNSNTLSNDKNVLAARESKPVKIKQKPELSPIVMSAQEPASNSQPELASIKSDLLSTISVTSHQSESPMQPFAQPSAFEGLEVAETTSVNLIPETLTPTRVEQVEKLIISLPEIIHDQLANYMQFAEPEAIAATEMLVTSIAAAADRLHELTMSDAQDGPEAEQIEALIREWYEELLTTAGITFDEETIDQLIELIKSDDYGQDKGTHEYKLPGSALSNGVTSSAVREQEIGRVAVQRLVPA